MPARPARALGLSAVTTLLTFSLILPGCAAIKEMLEDVPTPKISFKGVKIDKLSWTDADMIANFNLTNPYPVGITVDKMNWKLNVDGGEFLSGSNGKEFTVAARKGGNVPVPFSFTFSKLLSTIKSAQSKKEVPFELGGTLTVKTPVGPVGLPIRARGNLPVLKVPKVRFKTVSATMQGMTKMLFKVGIGVQHDNAYGLNLSTLLYDLKLEGFKVASGTASKNKSVASGAEAAVDLPIEVDLVSASSAVMSAITSGKIDYALGTDLNLNTPFGNAPLPWDYSGSVKLY